MGAGNSTSGGSVSSEGDNGNNNNTNNKEKSIPELFIQTLQEYENNPEFLEKLRNISKDPQNFRITPSKEIADALDPLFETRPDEDEPPYVQLAKKLLVLDPNLHTVRRKLVPSRVKELAFWRNHLTHIVLLDDQKLHIPRKSTQYLQERQVAIAAVQRACKVAQLVFSSLVSAEVVTKSDKSPVTVADYGVQAIINAEIKKAFPNDPIVAEEHSSEMKQDIKTKIVRAVNAIEPPPGTPEEEIIKAIDLGVYEGGSTGRFWAVDPIDGTLGFLRGEQFAVCLALIENGEVVLGVLGCPNLEHKGKVQQKGSIFYAEKGRGAYSLPLGDDKETPIHVQTLSNVAEASFCESVEAAHSSHSDAADIAQLLKITAEPIRMDSQCKYAAIARGDATIYLRLPTRAGYEEKIWDHAAGWLIVREAGGEVTDIAGNPLDFSVGRTLKLNKGVVATNKKVHAKVIETVQYVLNPKLHNVNVTIKRERRSAKEIKEAIATGLGVDPKLIVVEEISS